MQDNVVKQGADIMLKMREHFKKRTAKHIDLVKKYCERLNNNFDDLSGILERGERHDASKYSDEEKLPYIYLTWEYRCKRKNIPFTMSPFMRKLIKGATKHHITTNAHHPECSDPSNPKKGELVDGTKMSNLDLAEMVADWAAMSEELGGTPKEWADDNVGVKWKFTPEQKEKIYLYIQTIWKDPKKKGKL